MCLMGVNSHFYEILCGMGNHKDGNIKWFTKRFKMGVRRMWCNVTKMNKEDMIKILEEIRDFNFQKTCVEELILSKGHRVMFIPKFHCEINPIERVWCSAKQYTRAQCDYSFQGLKKTLGAALDSVDVEITRKFYRKVRKYHRAYRNNVKVGKEMEKTLKVYKSHRRVTDAEQL